MIVRDEEAHLAACLASLEGVVDEVVVIDTGSVDHTVDIARSFGARVHEEEWVDDFSRARNSALDRARGRWILYIDADERLRPVARTEVVALLDTAHEVAFRLRLRPFVGATPLLEYRLWRNDARIRFEGVIHEKVVPAIEAVAAADGRRIGVCDLALDHVGYEGDQLRKHHRNLPLLQAQLEAEPRNVFNWRHLAKVLEGVGRPTDAEQALERALELVRTADDLPPAGRLVFADLAASRRDRRRSAELLDEGLSLYPGDPLLLWTGAALDIDAGEPVSALAWLDRLAAVDRTTLDDTMSYDERLFGALVHEARGLCLFRLERFDEAATAYGAAERCEPDNAEHRAKRLMAEHLARR
jgi:cytochrome c-type biogenesis protein CcmH/NrfG